MLFSSSLNLLSDVMLLSLCRFSNAYTQLCSGLNVIIQLKISQTLADCCGTASLFLYLKNKHMNCAWTSSASLRGSLGL